MDEPVTFGNVQIKNRLVTKRETEALLNQNESRALFIQLLVELDVLQDLKKKIEQLLAKDYG